MKNKIAVLTTGWATDYLIKIYNGIKNTITNLNTDIYFFTCYQFNEINGQNNSTGYNIFNLIDYKNFDGVIILSDLILDPTVLEREHQKILKAGIPAVAIGKPLKGLHFIKSENFIGYNELIEHLITKHNITKFAYIGGPENDPGAMERKNGFVTSLKKHNLAVLTSNIFLNGNWSIDFAYNNAKTVFERPSDKWPEAFICINDFSVLGVIQAAREKNIKIPEQVKVIGFDNLEISTSSIPSISTVDCDIEAIGESAIKLLMSQSKDPKSIKIPSKAVFRQSCGCVHDFSPEQTNFYNHKTMANIDFENFSTQLGNIEDIFLNAQDTYSLINDLGNFFYDHNHIEGGDFSILLNSDWTASMANDGNEVINQEYSKQLNSIITLQSYERKVNEIISSKDLIPSSLTSTESSMYILLPIYNKQRVFGYFISKDNPSMIKNKNGYNWTKNFGSALERFRQKNMYKLMSEQFLKLSTTDGLSGVLNRVAMKKLAEPFYNSNKKNGFISILLFIDINSMKIINDKFGHLHGDLAVKTVANTISSVIPRQWLCVRYGGDEFFVLGNNKNYRGEDFCNLITTKLKENTSKMALPYPLTVSTGAITIPSSSPLSLEDAVKKVDEVMYLNKKKFHDMQKR